MKRLILSLAALAMLAGMVGCHASADIDPHHSTQVVPAR
jgi:hypothetical protein